MRKLCCLWLVTLATWSWAPPLPFYVPESFLPYLQPEHYLIPLETGPNEIVEQANRIIQGEINRNVGGNGKRIRPLLTFLAAALVGLPPQQALHIARIVEYVHGASLMHDDVIDEDDERRGEETTRKKVGNKRAVLHGDSWLALLTQLSLRTLPHPIAMTDEVMQVIRGMAIGEEIQAAAIKRGYYTDEEYREIIIHKTGLLFGWAMTAPTYYLIGEKELVRKRFQDFAIALGELYQIWDDLDPADYKKMEANLVRHLAAKAMGSQPSVAVTFTKPQLEIGRDLAMIRLRAKAQELQEHLIPALIIDAAPFLKTSPYHFNEGGLCEKSLRSMVDFLSSR